VNRKPLRLHLGCGDRVTTGWLNIDAFNRPGLDLRWDLRDPLPCLDNVAECVYSEHFLEHLHREDANRFLEEICRLLQPGGMVRLGVPDAELYFRKYVEGGREFFEKQRHLGGTVNALETPAEVINQMFRMGGHHRFAWDFETLAMALRKVGFIEVTRQESGVSKRPDICLDDPNHLFETLYVEGIKPAASRLLQDPHFQINDEP
jgi:predicted SAM-dependent methyltransferase